MLSSCVIFSMFAVTLNTFFSGLLHNFSCSTVDRNKESMIYLMLVLTSLELF